MDPRTKIKPKPSSASLLIPLAVVLLFMGILAFSRTVDFGQFLRALTGSLTDASRYSLSQETLIPAAPTGALIVIATPDRARFNVLNAGTGAVALADRTGAEPLALAVGNYRIVFKPMAGYDTPSEVSTEVTETVPAKITTAYTPWPACTAGDWDCTKFYPCDPTTKQHTRICVLKNPRCTGGDAVQPALSEGCEAEKK